MRRTSEVKGVQVRILTEDEKVEVMKKRYGIVKPKETSRKRTDKELLNDDKIWSY